MIKVHEDQHHKRSLESRDHEANRCVNSIEPMPPEIEPFDGCHHHGDNGKKEQEEPNKHEELLRLLYFFNRTSHEFCCLKIKKL